MKNQKLFLSNMLQHNDTCIKHLSERNTDYQKENKFLKIQLIEKDKKITNQLQQIKELTTLNMGLQKSIISYFEEFKGKRQSEICFLFAKLKSNITVVYKNENKI